jgi:hypothetical protein
MMTLGMVEDNTDYAYENPVESLDIPLVRQALGAAESGGYPEAVARIRALIGQGAHEISLSLIEMTSGIVKRDRTLSKISEEELRRIRSEQAIIADLEPERAVNTLPKLLSKQSDRKRALKLLADVSRRANLTEKQNQILQKIRNALTN